MKRIASAECRELVEHFEGLRLTAYLDSVGVPTIGYGHTGPEVELGQTISAEKADYLLSDDLHDAERAVNNAVAVPLGQCQFDALCSLAFNIGPGAFAGSTLVKRLNAGDYFDAPDQISLWVHAGGKVLPGLEKRRAAEIALFEGEDWRARV